MTGNPFAVALAEALDPVVFARRLGIDPDPWQEDVLRSTEPRVCLCCSRQVGKSLTSSVLALHTALHRPGSLVLITAPSQRQSQELFRTVVRYYRALSRPVPPESENALSLVLENGSRIVSLPGDERTVRGYAAVDLLVVDEASRVQDDFMQAVLPTLAVSGGRVIALSTPFGRRGWFWRAATRHEGWDDWMVVQVRAEECPRIKPAFLERERTAKGDWLFRQEYGCEFVAGASSFFDPLLIEAAFTDDVVPLFGSHAEPPTGLPKQVPAATPVIQEQASAADARLQARHGRLRALLNGREVRRG